MKQNRSFRELDVWKCSKELTLNIYKVTMNFPNYELYCLTSQIRRAAISIPSNISEGIGRRTYRDTLKYLYISRGSLHELETQIIIAFELGYMNAAVLKTIESEMDQTGRLISGFIKYYEQKDALKK